MKHTITKLFLLLLLATAGTAKAQQWTEIQTGVNDDLYDVLCIDDNTALVCGENGVILKTEDGGNSWQEKYRDDGAYLNDLFFVDNLTGFAAGSLLLKTTDGGNSWTPIDIPYPYWIDQIYALDADTLYYITDLQLFKSTNGGMSSSLLIEAYPGYWSHDAAHSWTMYFEDNVGYFAYAADELGVYKTTDYGNSWEKILETTDYYLPTMLQFFNKDTAKFFANPEPENHLQWDNVTCTENGFASTFTEKSYFDQEMSTYFRGFKFTSQNNGCFIAWAEEADLYYAAITNDGGTHWKYSADGLNTQHAINGVDGIDTVYYIAADNGCVYRTWRIADNTDESCLSDVSIFPNPIGQTIDIDAKNARNVEIIDNTGRTVVSLPVKQDHVTVDCSKIGSGIYVVVITDNNGKRHVKKMIK